MAMTRDDILEIIGRKSKIFDFDIAKNSYELDKSIEGSSFLIIGAGGSIGQAVAKEISNRNPKLLYCVDISENSLAELVRDLRSSGVKIDEFKTFTIDAGSNLFDDFMKHAPSFDYILNLSAMKHVRSEKDLYSLKRMIDTNVFYTKHSVELAIKHNAKKYFCVSTDKAANPVNFMGASKRIMELFLTQFQSDITISSSRFANVAFSHGSLLEGFKNRLEKNQPIAAPNDIKRYFVTSQEAGELCMMSAIFGESKEIYFPKLMPETHLISLKDVAVNYLKFNQLSPIYCESEEEAINSDFSKLRKENLWPCYFGPSYTSGEKRFEEFFLDEEIVDNKKYKEIGIVKNTLSASDKDLLDFENNFKSLDIADMNIDTLKNLFCEILENFEHIDTGHNLDERI
jgi:FlaA1/EpsC-like NDP-sugar epimerase